MADRAWVGGIELGGTKIILAVGRSDGQILTRATLPTRDPAFVIPEACAFFRDCGHDLAGLGVGAFGPIIIDPTAPGHGRLLETNKPGWSGFDLLGALTTELGLPVRLVTDVGAAALAEARLGALRGAGLGIYLTVGTGIGGAIVAHGQSLPAMLHPEMGHIALHRRAGDAAASVCQFHADCAEGLAAGPAVLRRFGQPLSHFAAGSEQHLLIADYLGQLCANLVLTLSPHRIVLGGGVAKTQGLIEEVHRALLSHLGGYAVSGIDAAGFLCAPALGEDAGIVGALLCSAGPTARKTH